MKQIKLRKSNRIKYCPNCKEMVSIVMIKLDGFCPHETDKETLRYLSKLYTIDNKKHE